MSFQGGSRFGQSRPTPDSNYYNLNSFSNTNYNASPFPPQNASTIPPSSNLASDPNYTSTPPVEGQSVPLSKHLAVFNSIDKNAYPQELLLLAYDQQERVKLKAENASKYNLNPESILYRFYPRHLESIIVQYPQDFPPTMIQTMRQRLRSLRKTQDFFHSMMLGGFIYWVALRRRNWFTLTGNPIQRWTYMYIFASSWIDAGFAETDYLVKQVFVNSQEFENVINKHNLVPKTSGRLELLTS